MFVPVPDTYVAFRSGTVARPIAGMPSTCTGSSNDTAMSTMRPVPYVPPGLGEAMPSIDGDAVSTVIFAWPPSEPSAPGAGRISTASVPSDTARMDAAPPSSDRARRPLYSRLAAASPGFTS